MTQEEKAKCYDKAIERAKKHCADYVVETIFPELKESEDEKIRKALVEMVHDTTGDSLWVDYGVHKEDAITWLEKQGAKEPMTDSFEKELAEICNQLLGEVDAEWMDNEILECIGTSQWLKLCDDTAKRYKDGLLQLVKQGEHAKFRDSIQVGDKVTRNQDGVLVNLSQLKRVAKKDEKQGEQKHADKVEPKFKIGDKVHLINGSSPNYEDDCIIIGEISNNTYYGNWEGGYFAIKDQDNYELVELNLAWSEEDENRINRLIAYFEDKESFTAEDDVVYANWLKSIRPQNRWKPSDEQMKALKETCDEHLEPDGLDPLYTLYQDLKRLREE